MHEKVQTRNCTGLHQSWRKISQRSYMEKKMYFDAWKLTYCTTIQTCGLFSILHQPKSWHKSSITKSNKRRDDDDAEEETLVPVCWMVMKNQTKNGIFFCDLWWFLMISLRLPFFQWNFLTTLFLAIFPKKYFLKRRMLPQLLLHPRYFRE